AGAQEVTLSAEQYAALLDRLAELEEVALSKAKEAKKETYDVDELAKLGKAVQTREAPREEEVDLEQLSNKELVNYVLSLGQQTISQQLLALETKLETLRVQREIDKCEQKYKDFWDYEEDIKKIAVENPSLSIEQAYRLAKSLKEEKGENLRAPEAKPRTQVLFNLPPRPPMGEKPGRVAPKSTQAAEIKTLKDAAAKAWEEVVGGKSEI
ncbi:MAG: hypothetical protein K6T27_09410, partial [Thermoleophilum sp.]|nr:hypothetical protein [Thermoleophilum sp.]